jgi:formylglycine-generating enzyme required for sulfatase activity
VGLTEPNTGANSIANNLTNTTSINGRAVASVASGYPIANINQINSIDYCANQNTISGASLISNAEWMTIARNIEAQPSNWRDGIIGSIDSEGGGLYIGHSDESSNNNILPASENDNDGYFGTDNISPSNQKRTHILSNGEIIWDLGANVWEWTSDTIMFKDQPYALLTGGFTWQNYPNIIDYGTRGADLWRPSNPAWGEEHNVGSIRVIGLNELNTIGGIVRGGSMRGSPPYLKFAGIYFANASRNISTSIDDGGGFRCVVR